MEQVLVDTSMLIDYLRCKEKNKTPFYRIFSQSKYHPVISLITVTELWAGQSLKDKKTLRVVEELVKKCKIIYLNLKTSKQAGEILRQTNYQVSFQDAQIAALALENQLPLFTLDTQDFQKIKGLKFLSYNL